MTTQVNRFDFEQLKGISPKLIRFFEELFSTGQSNAASVGNTVEATNSIQAATVLVLSQNAAFTNERVLTFDPQQFDISDSGPGGNLTVTSISTVTTEGGFTCVFTLSGDTLIDLPTSGRIPSSADGPYASDSDAAAAGIPIGGIYKAPAGVVVWRQA